MQKNFTRVITLLIILLQAFFITAVNAAAPVVHISPKPVWLNQYKAYDKKVASRDVAGGYFYQVLEEQLNVEKQADYTHIIKEIVSEAGIQNGSSISIGFDPSFERLDVHEIIVWRNNVAVNRLSASSFKVIADEKELSRFIYQGSYSAYCILDDIRKGDKIEYSYTVTGRNPIFNNKFFRELYFQSSVPFAHVYKSILVSPSRKLNFKSFNKAPQASVSVKDGLTNYQWNDYQVMPAPYYDNQPGWYNNYAYIQVSDYNSWKEVTDWALSVNPVMPVTNGKLAVKVAELKAATKGDKEKYFRAVVKMVQDEVRYMGIEMGEYSHRANNPEKVFNQRYGDCKDKSLLLASVLKAGGIDAEMVLINSGVNRGMENYIPSPGAFDHAIVVATVNNKQVWVDATIAYQRGTGTNIYFPAYGMGLVLKPGNDKLTAITPPNAGKTKVNECYTITSETNKVKFEVTSVYTLGEADKIRDRLASASISETEKSYLNYYTKIYPKIEQTDSLTIIDNEETNKLTTIEHYSINGLLKKGKEDGRYTAGFYANSINDQLPNIPNKAVSPIAVAYPLNLDYTIQVVIPSGWNIEKSNYEVKRDAYVFKSQSSERGDTLLLNYKLNYLSDFIPVNKLDEARDDAKKISDDELSYSFTYTPDVSKVPYKVNYWMVALVLVFIAGLITAGVKIYRTETPGLKLVNWRYQPPIGGWLILIAIGLAITPLIISATIFTNGSFDLNKWGLSIPGMNKTGYNAAFLFETLGNVFSVCYSAFCFYLLIQRRDIFPKFMIGWYAFYVLFVITDYIILQSADVETSKEAGTTILRSIIGAAIWIPYFIKSTRVQKTFIIPYPTNNYMFDTNVAPQTEEQEITEE